MTSIKFEIPEYDDAMTKFIDKVIQEFIKLDPIIGDIPTRITPHHGPIRNIRNEEPLDHNFVPQITNAKLPISVIIETDIRNFSSFLYQLQESIKEKKITEILQRIGEITTATGNNVYADGKPFSWDLYLDAIEKLPISFSEDGEPIMPKAITSPNLAKVMNKTPLTKDQLKRRDEIINMKREEFYAKKHSRRLS
jgi:hypothetical protein